MLRPFARLIRLPNLCTAWPDPLAGAAIALGIGASTAGSIFGWLEALLLGASGVLLYAGGVALNDAIDLPFDRVHHPDRPLVTGLMSRPSAFVVAIAALLGGLALTWPLGPAAFAVTAWTLLAIVVYDLLPDEWAGFGATAMGLARAGNLARGAAAVGGGLALAEWPVALAILGHALVVAGISCIAALETRQAPTLALWRRILVLAPLSFVLIALILAGASVLWALPSVALALTLALWLDVPMRARPFRPGPTVGRIVFCLPALAGTWMLAFGAWQLAIAALAMLPLSRLLKGLIGQRGS